ncbi:MAG: AHH domain-containing protein [Terriglobia bacterium]
MSDGLLCEKSKSGCLVTPILRPIAKSRLFNFYFGHEWTNKNWISRAGGGPFSPQFAKLLDRAGMEFDDAVVAVAGHSGPHPEYNAIVLERLTEATEGLTGKQFEKAFKLELDKLMKETFKKGTELNKMITGR